MQNLLQWLKDVATSTPLPIFVFFGSILEELIPPIPAPVIMSFAAYLANERGAGLVGLLFLAIVGAGGKTIASIFLYWVGVALGGVISRNSKLSRWIGLTENRVKSLNSFLQKKWWDDLVLIFVRTIPVIPTFLVSLGSGVIRLPLKMFIWTTFVGTVLRNFLLICLGIYGTEYVQQFWEQEGQHLSRQPLVVTFALLGLLLGAIIATKLKSKVKLQ